MKLGKGYDDYLEYRKKEDAMNEGTKHDQEKSALHLLSSKWIYGVGNVLHHGEKKYAAHNWRKGIQLSRVLGATLRHVFAFLGGEDKDPESGLSHLLHASCSIMFAYELHETRSELDDRWKYGGHDGLDKTKFIHVEKCKHSLQVVIDKRDLQRAYQLGMGDSSPSWMFAVDAVSLWCDICKRKIDL